MQWRRKMIQEGGALVKGCSKSDAVWASFMGSFAILGGSSPPAPPFLRLCHACDSLSACKVYMYVCVNEAHVAITLTEKSHKYTQTNTRTY